MLNKAPILQNNSAFTTDTLNWFLGQRHGHMGKYLYLKSKYEGDPCQGNKLWDMWENVSDTKNMLSRQHNIMKEQINEMIALSGPRATLVDLGPGGENAVKGNTVPAILAYGDSLKRYIPIDINKEYVTKAASIVKKIKQGIDCYGLNADFKDPTIHIPYKNNVVALFNGGTIGNIEAEQNTPYAIPLIAKYISYLKRIFPIGTVIFIGLEATQSPDIIYGDYNHPTHAEFVVNIMQGIKRDLLSEENGFDPYAWKYSMKWWPESYQFCHIIEATKSQKFNISGQEISFNKGHQLVVDNSFKFSTLAMQRAVQMAKAEYLKPFADEDGRMIIHAIRF